MPNTYDVIVIGAGIPGLYATRELARLSKKVLIIDQSATPGEPNYSTAGTPVETIDLFQLPKAGIASTVTRFIYATKNNEAIKDSTEPVSYVLDFRKMKILLADEVKAMGGEVQWGVRAQNFETPAPDPTRSTQLLTLHTNKGDFSTQYLIDASGSTGQISVQAGIREARPSTLSVGLEYIVSAQQNQLQKFDHSLSVYLDTELCPYGYAWVFDQGNQTYKVGLAEYYLDPKRGLPTLDQRLETFLKWLTKDAAQPVTTEEKHGGSKFITTNFHKVHAGNILAIGDVIGAINPLFGEGIRHGLFSAKFAVEAIAASNPQHYETAWKNYIGKNWKKTEFQAHLLYDKADRDTQNLYELAVKNTQKYSTAQSILKSGYYYQSKSFFAAPFTPLRSLRFLIAGINAYL